MTRCVRVGVVGTGWGAHVQVPAFRLVDGFEVVALCARRPESVQAAAARTGIDDTSTDFDSFVRRDDLDLIAIATPVALHHPMTMAALEAGKHVLVEKPMAVTAQQCREMAAAAERTGTVTAVCFELRWTPPRAKIRSLVEAGFVGEPFWVRLSETGYYAHPSHPNQALWMYDAAQGGGFLNGTLSHDIDFVCSLFGPPKAVFAEVHTAITRREPPGGPVVEVTSDDTDVVLMRMADGGLVMLSMAATSVDRADGTFEVFGRSGTITADVQPRSPAATIVGSQPGQLRQDLPVDDRMPASGRSLPARRAAPLIRAVALMLEDWLPAFASEPTPSKVPSFADGVLVQEIMEAARESSAGGMWIELGSGSR